MTQQVSNKKSAEKSPENKKTTTEAQSQDLPRFQGRYEVKPEFWDRILDSIPPWSDEIAAILLIVFGIVSFLSLFDVSSDATISNAWKNALTTLFGYGSYIVSGGILMLGVLILLPKAGVNVPLSRSRILALQIAFLSFLALLHLLSGDLEWRALARAGQGGGVIGWG